MERDLSRPNYRQSSVTQKGASIGNALKNLRNNQQSSATTHVMREMRVAGAGYNRLVAGLDKRTYNSPSEKKQIDMARRKC